MEKITIILVTIEITIVHPDYSFTFEICIYWTFKNF